MKLSEICEVNPKGLVLDSNTTVSFVAMSDVSEDGKISTSDIRKYHECTHFVCRRLYREKKDPVWDELVADAVGLYAAFGKYDISLAELFLGIKDGRYTGGRLENYLDKEAGTQSGQVRAESLDKLAAKLKDKPLHIIAAVIVTVMTADLIYTVFFR